MRSIESLGNQKLKNAHQREGESGFSLIETIIALFVLTVGVGGAFIVVSRAIHVSPVVRQELIASNLAQETIEIVRNIRDNTLLQIADVQKSTGLTPASPSWASALPTGGAPGSFQSRIRLLSNADPASGWVAVCCSAAFEWQQVFIHDVMGVYANLCVTGGCSQAGWADSGFRRALRIEKYVGATLNNGCTTDCTEVRVQVKVWWGSNAEPAVCPAESCVLAEDRLTEWVNYLWSIL